MNKDTLRGTVQPFWVTRTFCPDRQITCLPHAYRITRPISAA